MDLSSPIRDAKALGAFYTPESVAEALAEWVVRPGVNRILEPSAGDGALILAAAAHAGGAQLTFVTCDVDKFACAKLRTILPGHCVVMQRDFLEVAQQDVGTVDAVLANPPFTRNHNIPTDRRAAMRKSFGVDGAAGLWVYFLFHSMTFLRKGGRLAFIVPASAIFSRYGKAAIAKVCANFSHVAVKRIAEWPVWVNGAEERGAMVFASGYGEGRSEAPELTSWSSQPSSEISAVGEAASSINELLQASSLLSSLAQFRIGVVTGRNDIFLLNDATKVAEGISASDVLPVVSRARQLNGIRVTTDELAELAAYGEKTWLLAPDNIDGNDTPVRRRLARISARQRQETVWLNKRSPWWKVDAGPPCDAIFTYMNHLGPRLALAADGVRCTNTLHRVNFFHHVEESQRFASALSLISSFGQLVAECTGRSYGGGVLKFELYEARSLPVIAPKDLVSEEHLNLADAALKAGALDRAREIADQAILPSVLGPGWQAAAREIGEQIRIRRDMRNRRKRSG